MNEKANPKRYRHVALEQTPTLTHTATASANSNASTNANAHDLYGRHLRETEAGSKRNQDREKVGARRPVTWPERVEQDAGAPVHNQPQILIPVSKVYTVGGMSMMPTQLKVRP